LLTAAQKDLLVSDVIEKVAAGGTSLVEVAYRLLVAQGGGRRFAADEADPEAEEMTRLGLASDSGLEEFADQCVLLCVQLGGGEDVERAERVVEEKFEAEDEGGDGGGGIEA
jgi:hypothetical protein